MTGPLSKRGFLGLLFAAPLAPVAAKALTPDPYAQALGEWRTANFAYLRGLQVGVVGRAGPEVVARASLPDGGVVIGRPDYVRGMVEAGGDAQRLLELRAARLEGGESALDVIPQQGAFAIGHEDLQPAPVFKAEIQAKHLVGLDRAQALDFRGPEFNQLHLFSSSGLGGSTTVGRVGGGDPDAPAGGPAGGRP